MNHGQTWEQQSTTRSITRNYISDIGETPQDTATDHQAQELAAQPRPDQVQHRTSLAKKIEKSLKRL